jgi:hypothetical protein
MTKGVRYGRKISYTGKIVYRRKTNRFTLKRVARILDTLFNDDDGVLSPDATIFYIYQRAARWMDQRDLIRQIYGTAGKDFPGFIKQYQEFINWFDQFANSSAEVAKLISSTIPALSPFAELVVKAEQLYALVRASFPIE